MSSPGDRGNLPPIPAGFPGDRCGKPPNFEIFGIARHGGTVMKSRLILPVLFFTVMFLSGCAGPQWEQRMVTGSNGPVYEIRSGRSPSTAPSPPQQLSQMVSSQSRHEQIQEQILRQAARMSLNNFSDYKVGPEDLLYIGFLDADRLTTEARINGKGEIRLLLVGDVPVAGLSTTEVASKLTRLYLEGKYLTNPQIMVTVREYRHQKVAVTGAVNKPDQYPLIGPRTLLEVLSMAGGISPQAGDTIQVTRYSNGNNSPTSAQDFQQQPFTQGTETLLVNLLDLLVKGATELNIPIHNGDVVFVPPARSAYVLGSVLKPGSVALHDNMTVAKAISQVGGLNPVLGSNNIVVLRVEDNGERQTIPVDLSQVTKGSQEDLSLQPNDVVFVYESSVRRFFYNIKILLPTNVGMGIPGLM